MQPDLALEDASPNVSRGRAGRPTRLILVAIFLGFLGATMVLVGWAVPSRLISDESSVTGQIVSGLLSEIWPIQLLGLLPIVATVGLYRWARWGWALAVAVAAAILVGLVGLAIVLWAGTVMIGVLGLAVPAIVMGAVLVTLLRGRRSFGAGPPTTGHSIDPARGARPRGATIAGIVYLVASAGVGIFVLNLLMSTTTANLRVVTALVIGAAALAVAAALASYGSLAGSRWALYLAPVVSLELALVATPLGLVGPTTHGFIVSPYLAAGVSAIAAVLGAAVAVLTARPWFDPGR